MMTGTNLGKIPIGLDIIGMIKKHKNLYLLLINEQEFERFECLKAAEDVFRKYDFDPKKVFLVNNNARNAEYKEEFGINLNVHGTRAEPLSLTKIPKIDFIEDKKGPFFMSHNHSLREHRLGLICLLKKYGIIENFDWSYLRLWTLKDSDPMAIFGRMFNKTDLEFLKDEIDFLIN